MGTHIQLLHMNIRTLDGHYGELLDLNSMMGECFDFITLTEIWPRNLDSRAALIARDIGFNYEFDPPKSTKGGAGFIFNPNLNLTERKDIKLILKKIGNSELTVENVWFDNGRTNYVIGVIYRHPGSSVECMDDFTVQLETLMAKVNNENKKCRLFSDINVDALKIDKNEHVKLFFHTVLQNDFIPTITLPTRIVEGSVSLLDHILINTKIIKNDCNIITGNIFCCVADLYIDMCIYGMHESYLCYSIILSAIIHCIFIHFNVHL